MSFWKFAYWSLRTADWAVIGGTTVGVAIGGYALYDYQKRHQKEEWNPTPLKEKENAGRFGNAFPVNKEDYKRAQKKQITLEELEWNIKDRQRQYRQYMQDQKTSKS